MSGWIRSELRDVIEVEEIVRKQFLPSPLVSLNSNVVQGIETLLKLDNLLPTGSFKVMGSTFLIYKLNPDEIKARIIAASTGNFSQG